MVEKGAFNISLISSINQLIKVGLSPYKEIFYLLQGKPFKNNEKCFLLHLKSSFHSQDI